MSTTLIYFCPIDHHRHQEWDTWADELRACLLPHYDDQPDYAPTLITIKEQAVYQYTEHTPGLDQYNQEDFADQRGIDIRWWSSIVFYSAVALRVGDSLDLLEVKRRLSHLHLLNEHRGYVAQKNCKLAVYHHEPLVELRLRQLIHRQGNCVYLSGNNDIPEQDWLLAQLPSQHSDVFLLKPEDDRHDHQFWAASMNNRLTVVSLSSSFVDAMMLTFHDYDDLQLFLGRWRIKELVITVGSCHMDDRFIAVYNLPGFVVEGHEPLLLL